MLEPGFGTAKATALLKKLSRRQQLSTARHMGEPETDIMITATCCENGQRLLGYRDQDVLVTKKYWLKII